MENKAKIITAKVLKTAMDKSAVVSVERLVKHPVNGKQIFRLRPLLDEQEFTGNRSDNAYWEGACEVLNDQGKRIGSAYLELAGYGGGLGARLN